MDHMEVEQSLEKLIDWYENKAHADEMETGHKFFWNFLRIHPFHDGNGRMARLLFSYHMFWTGTPFAVCITSGKSRSRKHYNAAIKREDLNISNLYTLLTYSKYLAWKNFIDHHKATIEG
ncbi:fido domain-containing protein DDB_G0283145-like [Hydractinia symbiolongicarpus]|uniref:fido domain-containing protein DDB_G0283145-like n=1 Tax=Hydractinia symbiolongicarpus TaxID=13093 RepID=UPI0025509E4F|nr:fido domain-containing protein DDB_G0283145-like [Hydractinia symbiolongicarpus]